MRLSVTKQIRSDDTERWQFTRFNEFGQQLDNSVAADGYATLAELLDDVKARFPGDTIEGIGADEPEAEGLSW